MKKYITFLLATLPMTFLSAEAITLDSSEVNLVSNFRFRVQNRFSYESQNTKDLSGKIADFTVRRARIRYEGSFWDPRLLFKFQLGVSNQDMGEDKNTLRDAVVGWRFAPKTTIWLGQTKLPGNRQSLTSSGDLNLVDRSIVNGKLTLDRDQGAQLHHEIFDKTPLRFKLAISNGEGRNRQNKDSGMSYTGRVEYLPFGQFKDNGDFTEGDLVNEVDHKLAFGSTYNSMKRINREGGTLGNAITSDGVNMETFVFDYIYKHQGLSLSGEYIKRSTNSQSAKAAEGFSSQFGKMLNNDFEPVIRFSKLTGDEKLDQSTIGLNKYLNKHKIKLQNDLSYSEGMNRSYWTYRLQLEVGI